MKEIVIDIEHPADKRPFDSDFKLSWVGVYDGVNVQVLKPEESRARLLEIENCLIIGHEIKYDIVCLMRVGLIKNSFDNVVDTMVAANVLNENIPISKLGLKSLEKSIFKRERERFDENLNQESDKFKDYLKQDLVGTWELWQYEKQKLKEQGLEKYFYNCIMKGLPAVAEMQYAGFAWDLEGAQEMILDLAQKRFEAEQELKNKLGDINLRSGDQLAEILFDKLRLKGVKKTKKRWSVDEESLEKMAVKYPKHKDLKRILDYRRANKMINTYLLPISQQVLDSYDQRIHASFWMTSRTGRMRSDNPNLQNVPVLKEYPIRKLLVAKSGCKLVVLDYSQEELRIMAHVSGDDNMIAAYTYWKCEKCNYEGHSVEILHKCPNCGAEEPVFWHGGDLHQNTLDKIPALKSRKPAKTANFACIYGAAAQTLHSRCPDLTVKEWEHARQAFIYKIYPGIGKYHKRQEHALQQREVKDIFGRKRRFDLREIRVNKRHCLNMAYNAPIQMSGAGIMYLALHKCRNEFKKHGWWLRKVNLVNAIHDELVFEIQEEILDMVMETAIYQMEHVVQLKVPLRVDAVVVDRWSDAK